MEDIRSKVNLVAGIGTIGAIIALIGVIMSYTGFPGCVTILDLVAFCCITLVSAASILPNRTKSYALLSIIAGIFGIILAFVIYSIIADTVDAKSFMDVGMGAWMTIGGMILQIIFSISDYRFKSSQ
jgi:hypothetical protein